MEELVMKTNQEVTRYKHMVGDFKHRLVTKQTDYDERVTRLVDAHVAERLQLDEQNKMYKLLVNEQRTENQDLKYGNSQNLGLIED